MMLASWYGKPVLPGDLIIQLNWTDEPDVWKDFQRLSPALSSTFQIKRLLEEWAEIKTRHGLMTYDVNFRIASYAGKP